MPVLRAADGADADLALRGVRDGGTDDPAGKRRTERGGAAGDRTGARAAEEPILEGWGLAEIEALARYLWDSGAKAYGSYGKLRGWCDNVGRLPPLPEGL